MFSTIFQKIKKFFKLNDCTHSTKKYTVQELSKKDLKSFKIKVSTKRAKHYLLVGESCCYNCESIVKTKPLVLFVLTNTMPNIFKKYDLHCESLLKVNEIVPVDVDLESYSDKQKCEMFETSIHWLLKNNKGIKSLLVYDKQLSTYGYQLGYIQTPCNKKPRTVISWGNKEYDSKLIYQTSKRQGNTFTKVANDLRRALVNKDAKYITTPLILGYVINIIK